MIVDGTSSGAVHRERKGRRKKKKVSSVALALVSIAELARARVFILR